MLRFMLYIHICLISFHRDQITRFFGHVITRNETTVNFILSFLLISWWFKVLSFWNVLIILGNFFLLYLFHHISGHHIQGCLCTYPGTCALTQIRAHVSLASVEMTLGERRKSVQGKVSFWATLNLHFLYTL